MQAAGARLQEQLRMAAALMKLRTEVEGGSGTDQIKDSLMRMLDEFAPFDAPPSDRPSSRPRRPRPVAVR